jgi:two-component system, LytTR family, response regulator LytT
LVHFFYPEITFVHRTNRWFDYFCYLKGGDENKKTRGMKKRRILIAEDIRNVSVDIRYVLEGLGYDVVKIVGSAEDALRSAEEELPDLVLMDTDSGGSLSGIEAATMLFDLHGVPVVFLSGGVPSDLSRAVAASEAYGIVMKPFRPETLHAAIEIALNKHSGPGRPQPTHTGCLFVRAEYRHNRIDFDKILYVEALKDYVVIHMLNGTITTHTTIKGIEEALPPYDFVRIHRSYIVRVDKIHSVKYPDLMIEGKMKVLPVGGHYKKNLFNRLNTLQ